MNPPLKGTTKYRLKKPAFISAGGTATSCPSPDNDGAHKTGAVLNT